MERGIPFYYSTALTLTLKAELVKLLEIILLNFGILVFLDLNF